MSNLILKSKENNGIDLFSEFKDFKSITMNENVTMDRIYMHLDSMQNQNSDVCIIESCKDFNKMDGFDRIINSIFHSFRKVIVLFDSKSIDPLLCNFYGAGDLFINSDIEDILYVSQVVKDGNDNYLFRKKLTFKSKKSVLFTKKDINDKDFFINKIDKNKKFLSITSTVDVGISEATFVFDDKSEDNSKTIKTILKTLIV